MYLKTKISLKLLLARPSGSPSQRWKQFFNTIETIHYHLFWDFGSEAMKAHTNHVTINLTSVLSEPCFALRKKWV